MKITFIPIFKTKKTAEAKALKICLPFFNERNMPYLELIHFLGEQREAGSHFLHAVSNVRHFAQYLRKQIPLPQYLEKTMDFVGNRNRIISVNVNGHDVEESLDLLNDFVSNLHVLQYNVAIRMAAGTSLERISEIFELLNSGDYFILDYETNNFSSLSDYSHSISKINHVCTVIAFSDERPKKAARLYQDNDFNYDFNTSIINAIQNRNFIFQAFGSYCGAKNDLTEEIRNPKNVFGVFVIFNYHQGLFYSIITNTGEHISKVYTPLREKIKSEDIYPKIQNLFYTTPLSRDLLSDILNRTDGKNLRCVDFLAISIVHYFEEIFNNVSG